MKNPNVQIVDFLKLQGVASVAVASTGSAWLFSYPTQKGVSYAFEYQMGSGGAVDVKVELEQGNELLTSAQEALTSANYVVPEDAAAFDAGVTDKNVHIKAYAPAATGYLRLKVTGQGSNAATTVITRARMTLVQTV
jgi:hypothetical protein